MKSDPVCGIAVDEFHAAARIDYLGKTYLFCSSECGKCFAANLAKYAQCPAGQPGAAAMQGALTVSRIQSHS
jgi:YHS domain-containing protein